jgi:hypothetical protein
MRKIFRIVACALASDMGALRQATDEWCPPDKGVLMQDSRTESVLTSLKIKFDYWPEYPLSKLVSDPLTQVRLTDNQAPAPEVKRYTDLLKGGAEFPPVVVMKDGRLIDGNTRHAAYSRQRKAVIPAYVCDVTSPALARRVGVELNSNHGKRMEKQELINWLGDGNGSVSEEDALRITGWSKSTISRVRGALHFEARRSTLVIPLNTALPDAVKAALVKVTDPDCFRELTVLADAAGLKPQEVNQVAKEVNLASLVDVGTALRVISDLRAASAQRIEEHRAGLRVRTPLNNLLNMHLGWIVKQEPSALHDRNQHTGPRSQILIEQAIRVLREALERYDG